MKKAFRPPFFRSLPGLLGATALGLFAMSAQAMAADPIKIGVIAEAQAIAGASIPQAAQMAADEINAKGGVDGRKIEIITYDNHSSSGIRFARSSARSMRTRSTSSSRATSAKWCSRSNPGLRV